MPEGGLEVLQYVAHAKCNKKNEKNEALSIIIMMPSTYVCIHFMTLRRLQDQLFFLFWLEDIFFLCCLRCARNTPKKWAFLEL